MTTALHVYQYKRNIDKTQINITITHYLVYTRRDPWAKKLVDFIVAKK